LRLLPILALGVSTNGEEVYAGHGPLQGFFPGSYYIYKFDGTAWTLLGGGISDVAPMATPVSAILVQGHDVYVGGQFWHIGGHSMEMNVRRQGATKLLKSQNGTGRPGQLWAVA